MAYGGHRVSVRDAEYHAFSKICSEPLVVFFLKSRIVEPASIMCIAKA